MTSATCKPVDLGLSSLPFKTVIINKVSLSNKEKKWYNYRTWLRFIERKNTQKYQYKQ